MKVSFFTPTRPKCGIADYSRFLLEALGDRADVQVYPCEPIASRDDYAELGRALGAADVAHIQYEHGLFLVDDNPAENFDAMMREIRVPTVVTLHCLPLDHPLWRSHLDNPALSFLVHTQDHLRDLRARGVRGYAEVTPLPASPRVAASIPTTEYRRKAGLIGKTVLGIFGFTKRHKGYDLALEALPGLPEDTVLLIAGGPQNRADSEYLAEVFQRARDLGVQSRIPISGYIPADEVGAALGTCDIVIAPFTTMTASASITTALAWERPVVAADLPPNVELRSSFGCLELFETGNPADLAQKVMAVAGDPGLRKSLCSGARRFHQAHSYRDLADRTGALYERVLGLRG